MTNWLRVVFVICLITLLIGCGVRTTYNNLDWLALRWLNQQMDLSNEQEKWARDAIDQKLAWHCASELPEYIDLIERIDRDVASGNITVKKLDRYGEEISAFGWRLLERAQPSLIELLSTLDDHQVDDLIASIEERNDEITAETVDLTPDEQNAQRVERMDGYLRRLFGSLNAEQQKRLNQWVLERQSTADYQLRLREARDQQFIQALAVRKDPITFEQQMTALFQPNDLATSQAAETFKHRTAHNRANILNTLVDIYELADERQIDRLRDRLDDLAEDFRELSCRV